MSKGKVLNPIRLSGASSPYLEVAKIKVEKKDPEIEKKIHTVQLGNCIHLRRDKQSHESNESLVNINAIKRENNKEQSVNEERTTCNETSMETECSKSQEETKCIAPVKSSNEILTELFKVFNATPPEELLDNDNSLKKGKHKKHKKEKKKKKKKSKGSLKSDGELIDASESSASTIITKEDDYRSRHKKHKKHKHKQEKSKDDEHVNGKLKTKAKSRDKELEKEKEKVQVKNKDGESKYFSSYFVNSHKRFPLVDENVDTPVKRRRTSSEDRRLQRDKEKKHNSFYNGFHDSENHRKDAEHVGKGSKEAPRCGPVVNEAPKSVAGNNGDVSEISLSDEEAYLQERKYLDEKRRRYSPTDAKGSCRYRSHHKGTYGRSQRSQSNERGRRYHHHHRSRSHSARRTRSRSRSRDLGIDKKRLLEIARKNAISMFKRGNLPGCAQMSEEVKDKVLLKMRYGGRTVQDLTEFCKKLSNGEDLDDISDLSSDEDSDVDKAGNAKAFNHPFMLKEREPIVMHIRGSVPIFPKTDEQTKAISMQFPVSSGQQHRLTEGWIPVETKDQQPSAGALQPSVPFTMKSMTKNIFAKPVPTQSQQEPAFKAMTSAATLDAATTTKNATELQPESDAVPTVVDNPIAVAQANVAAPQPFAPDVPVPSSEPSVFPQSAGDLDVSHIISKRLNAMRRLQENPQDPEALKMMHNSQTEMTSWVSSKHLPGQFLGSTGANVLSARELSAGPQLWARRDQLTSTQPVTGGMGMQMLKKMGWKPGEGLGREKTGSLQPLLLDVKLDKRGLVSEEDNGYQRRPYPFKKRRSTNLLQAQQNLQEKHPVSLLNELTSKRKWTPPLYTLVNEDGPSHSKVFLFSVSINGQTFTPGQGSNTKKDAKVLAARNCLQQMGIIQ